MVLELVKKAFTDAILVRHPRRREYMGALSVSVALALPSKYILCLW